MNKIIIFGAGGHARSCIDVIMDNNKFVIAGFLDNKKSNFGKFKYLGSDKDIFRIKKKYNYAFIAIGQIKNNSTRINLFNKLLGVGYKFPSFISKKAIVSKETKIGDGTIIMHGAIVNSGAKIGKNSIINSGVIIEHDSQIGDHCHLAPGSIVNGQTLIGNGTFVGSGAVIRENIKVGKNCIISANCFVKKNLPKKSTFINEK